jgi:hypothetical protein
MLFGHALTSSALFFGIGILYDRYKLDYYFIMVLYQLLCLFFHFFILFLFYLILLFLLLLICWRIFNRVGRVFYKSNFICFKLFSFNCLFIYSLHLYVRIFFGSFSFFLRFFVIFPG